MKKISTFLSKALELLLMVLLALLTLFTFAQVVCRFILKVSISWSEEIVRMTFVWMILIGAALGTKEWSHLSMEIFTDHLKARAKRRLMFVVYIFVFVIYALFFYAGLQYCIKCVGKSAVTMRVPSNIVYSAIPTTCLIGMFFTIEHFIDDLKKKPEAI